MAGTTARVLTISEAMSAIARKVKKDQAAVSSRPPRRGRFKGYATALGLIIEPWVPVKGSPNVPTILKHLRATYPEVYIPESLVRKDTFMAFYDYRWRRFLVLDGRMHARVLNAAHGTSKEGYMPCDACRFWLSSKSLRSVLVGTIQATVQEFHVCAQCLDEGVLRRTRAAGYIARMGE